MIPQGLILQIGMIVIAGGIFFTYISPTYTQVAATNEEIATIKTERDRVKVVNDKLNDLLSKAQNINSLDRQLLATYLPAEIDPLAVQRDILSIAQAAQVELTSLAAKEVSAAGSAPAPDQDGTNPGPVLQKQQFIISFKDSYENLKNFLGLLEINNYPLHIRELDISGVEKSTERSASATDLGVDIVLETYALAAPSGRPEVVTGGE